MKAHVKYIIGMILPVLVSCGEAFDRFEVNGDFEKLDPRKLAQLTAYKERTFCFHRFQIDPKGYAIEWGNDFLDGRTYGKYFFIISRDAPHLILDKRFHPNGNIRLKGWRHMLASKIGVWYEFDEEGRLIAETDYDTLHGFTTDDVLAFCRERGIELADSYISLLSTEIYATDIWREKLPDEGWVWNVRYYNQTDYTEQMSPNYRFGAFETLILDGETGALIGKKAIPCEPPDLFPNDSKEDIAFWMKWHAASQPENH